MPRPLRRRPRAAGFTLVEMILVIAILVLVMSIALPTVGRSMKSARLKTSARELVALSRYARNAAILHGKQHVMLFHPDQRKVELLELQRTGFQGGSADPMASLETARQVQENLAEAEGSGTYEVKNTGLRTRQFPEGIDLEDFTCAAEEQEQDGVHWVNFYPNGMCDAHAYAVQDTRGKRITITVDGITGEIHVGANW